MVLFDSTKIISIKYFITYCFIIKTSSQITIPKQLLHVRYLSIIIKTSPHVADHVHDPNMNGFELLQIPIKELPVMKDHLSIDFHGILLYVVANGRFSFFGRTYFVHAVEHGKFRFSNLNF